MIWVLVAVILLAIGFVPVGVDLHYGESGFYLKLAVGLFRMQLLPYRGKPKTQKEKSDNKKETAKAKKTRNAQTKTKPKDTGGSLTDFLPLVPRVLDFLNGFRKRLRVNDLQMRLILAGEDPYALAMNYGYAQQALYSLQPQLERVLTVRRRDIEIECCFTAAETRIEAGMTITITIGVALELLLLHGFRILITFMKIRKKRKGGYKNESKTS